jgi:hypothetical protein
MSISAWWVVGINICVAFVVVLSTIAMLKPMMAQYRQTVTLDTPLVVLSRESSNTLKHSSGTRTHKSQHTCQE